MCTLESYNGAEKLASQALKFQNTGICHELPHWADVSHYTPTECFVEGSFNVST